MILIGFFIITVALCIIMIPLKSRIMNVVIGTAYSSMVAALSIYSFLNIDQKDSVFYQFDSLGVLFTAVLAILSFTTLYHSVHYLKRRQFSIYHESVYFVALMLLTTAMISTYFSQNIVVQWVSIEATTLFVSILIYHERTEVAVEASWKYLFVSSVGVAFAFIGILIMTIIVNDTSFHDLSFQTLADVAKTTNPVWVKATFLLILTGYSAKMGIFPLHTVTVDAHTAAPPPVSAFISTTLMNVGFFGIFRVFQIVAGTPSLIWAQTILFIVAVLSLFMSAVQILKIRHFKRMFVFSSLEHMGIVTLGLAVGGIGYYAAILQLVLHSFTKAGLFYQIDRAHSVYGSYWIKDSGDYFKLNPAGGMALFLGFISIVAIPPSGLFISEFMVFKALFAGSYFVVAVIALIFLTIIMYAFGKHIMHLLFLERPEHITEDPSNTRFESVSQFVLLGLAAYLGFFPPAFFSDLIQSAIHNLH
jgi:hydrogenase-4 component F